MLAFRKDGTRPLSHAQRRHWLFAGVLALLLLSGLHAFNVEKHVLAIDGEPEGFQANLARAFLDGDLDLGPAPEQLVVLADPWDPDANRSIRYEFALHDYAFYEGRIHSPFGPTPALLLHLPIRALTGEPIHPATSTLIWSIGLVLASFATYRIVTRSLMATRPWWGDAAALAAIGLAGPVLWLISIGRGYEESIACGAFLLMAGTAILARFVTNPGSTPSALLAIAGLVLGLAAGARPHLLAAGLLVIAAAVSIIRSRRPGYRVAVAALAFPYGAAVLALLAYNQARFGTPMEFGTAYQMAGMDLREYPLFDPAHLLPNLRDYLVGGPRFEARWPHIHLLENTFDNDPSRHTNEPVAGMLTTFPAIAVGLRCIPLAFRSAGRNNRGLKCAVLAVFTLACGLLAAISLPFSSSTMRYTVDFVPMFALLATISAVLVFGAATANEDHRGLRRVWVAALVWSSYAGLMLPLTPCPGTGSC